MLVNNYCFYFFSWHSICIKLLVTFFFIGVNLCPDGQFVKNHQCFKALSLGENCTIPQSICISKHAICNKICICQTHFTLIDHRCLGSEDFQDNNLTIWGYAGIILFILGVLGIVGLIVYKFKSSRNPGVNANLFDQLTEGTNASFGPYAVSSIRF